MAHFSWSSTFTVGEPIAHQGDKIILPQRALESLIQAHANAPPPPPPPTAPTPEDLAKYDPTSWAPSPFDNQAPQRPRELPSPLTFQIRNPANRAVTHGGVKEFSADDNMVHLPAWMMSSLSLAVSDQVMVKFQDLPKGTWAKFRPLSSNYTEIKDYRAAFEAFLRSHYNTLTAGEVLTIEQAKRTYQFVVEDLKPAAAVCITDTDLEVDIEPLDTTDMQIDSTDIASHPAKEGDALDKKATGTAKDTKERELKIGVESAGEVEVENYQRWTVKIPNRSSGIKIMVSVQEPGDLGNGNFLFVLVRWVVQCSSISVGNNVRDYVNVLVSTTAPVTLQDHIWANFESLDTRIIIIPATDHDYATQQDSETLHLAIYGRDPTSSSSSSSSSSSASYTVMVQYSDDSPSPGGDNSSAATTGSEAPPNEHAPGYQPCTNCGSWIPEYTMMLHTTFCMRNNTKCAKCGQVMKKEDAERHFHCDHCDKHGDISEQKKHMEIFHGWYQCSCGTFESAQLPELALHRRSDCSERFIICRYCHILVQQGGPSSNPRDRIRGLRAHESYCGDRTIECQKCLQMVSLKDVQVHARNHEYQRQNQPTPKLCTNQNCVRPRSTNVLGLCQLCFGPFWVSTDDPKHQKLIQRLAKKYHAQLMTGCGNSWCQNRFCATAKGEGMDATSAATVLIENLKLAKIGHATESGGGQLWLCVDEGTTKRKMLSQVLFDEQEGQYAIEWCVKALENVEGADLAAAVQWLHQQAPRLTRGTA
ncbi:hypothetical protein BGZ94_007605 [Podila epigama]|nr:hypothetical protein BGZ94_007605 [Podila epigama]